MAKIHVCSALQVPRPKPDRPTPLLDEPFTISVPYMSYRWEGRGQIRSSMKVASEFRAKAAQFFKPRIVETIDKGDLKFMGVQLPYLWERGQKIRVRFLNGDSALHAKVQQYARTWLEHANLDLEFGDDPAAEVRVSFRSDTSSWSAIGTACTQILGADTPTMNFDSIEEENLSAYVLHEFGHVLGCIHEHESPAAGINWDKPVVYEYYEGLTPSWSKQQVDENIFAVYAESQTRYSAFDPTSIMIYPIDNSFTFGQLEVGWNKDLSETDKEFIGLIYPK